MIQRVQQDMTEAGPGGDPFVKASQLAAVDARLRAVEALVNGGGGTGGGGGGVPQESADGTVATTPATMIVDSNHAIWLLRSDGGISRNAAPPVTPDVVLNANLLLYFGHAVYYRDTLNQWFQWSGTGWVSQSGDPRQPSGGTGGELPTSADGKEVTDTVDSIVDFGHHVWKIRTDGGISRDGGPPTQPDETANVILLLWFGGVLYQENVATEWYAWTGTGWTGATDPRTGGGGGSTPTLTPAAFVSGATAAGETDEPTVTIGAATEGQKKWFAVIWRQTGVPGNDDVISAAPAGFSPQNLPTLWADGETTWALWTKTIGAGGEASGAVHCEMSNVVDWGVAGGVFDGELDVVANENSTRVGFGQYATCPSVAANDPSGVLITIPMAADYRNLAAPVGTTRTDQDVTVPVSIALGHRTLATSGATSITQYQYENFDDLPAHNRQDAFGRGISFTVKATGSGSGTGGSGGGTTPPGGGGTGGGGGGTTYPDPPAGRTIVRDLALGALKVPKIGGAYQSWPTDRDGIGLSSAPNALALPGIVRLGWGGGSWTEWFRIAANAGSYDWSILDQVVQAWYSRGVEILYTLMFTPHRIASLPGTPSALNPGDTANFGGCSSAPNNFQEVEDFIFALFQRYNGGGVRKIKYLEIWNEPYPDFRGDDPAVAAGYWQGSVAPGNNSPANKAQRALDLARVFHYAERGCHRVDPGVKIILPGWSPGEGQSSYINGANMMMNAALPEGGTIRSRVDGMGAHPYSSTVSVGGPGLATYGELEMIMTEYLNTRNSVLPGKIIIGTEIGDETNNSNLLYHYRQIGRKSLIAMAQGWEAMLFWSADRNEDHFCGNPNANYGVDEPGYVFRQFREAADKTGARVSLLDNGQLWAPLNDGTALIY